MATDGWYPKAIRLPITTQEFYKTRAVPLVSICNHITDGTDSRDWLQHANNQSSVHFLIRDEAGAAKVYQFMSVNWAAWGNGRFSMPNPFMPAWVKDLIARNININHATVSIEHERKWPFTTMPSAVMTAASIDLHKWLVANYPLIEPTREFIIGHYQVDNVSRAHCPGGPGGKLFPFDLIISALNTTTPNTSPLWLPGAAFPIDMPQFKAFYQGEQRALQYFGLPIRATEQAVLSDGNTYTIQYFQRARFELHGDKVLLGLLGVEVLTP